ncbi:MAG: TonB-dependent receptor family protein [Gammaproteobacteria bacterium]
MLRASSAPLFLALTGAIATTVPAISSAQVLEEITIVGDPETARGIPGGANIIGPEELQRFEYADIQRIMRTVPGVSAQLEDGYGLRPNLSIRGTASDRSGRITLLEDNVLIAPAPYSAPAAYYFPTAGRMSQVEILKGPAAITQGPYTVGGAVNFVSTPIPTRSSGSVLLDAGQDNTSRLHAHYGSSGERFGWLAETHLWNAAGYQHIDQVGGDTGLSKDDWTFKFRVNGDSDAAVFHQLDVKLQYAEEESEQSYLGLADADFTADPYRRYSASQLDLMQTEHDQVILTYRASINDGPRFSATAYSNNHERAWFKTEGLDPDGSATAEDFSRTSWWNVIQAVNRGEAIGSLSPAALQATLDGADTVAGSIQVRNNAREYFSRGIQFGLDWDFQSGQARHELRMGLRFHEDEEDRLQRNSTYHLEGGQMVLDDFGLLGNAGNRIQEAQATAFFVHDRIEWRDWVFTPGFRYEDIDQARTRWETRLGRTVDPSSRAGSNIRDTRENQTDVLLPGVGVLYNLSDKLSVFGGVHKGFTAPSNAPNVDEEESVNFEMGLRASAGRMFADLTLFVTDYDNLLGVCTASSGVDCEVGDAFNGDAATISGLEFALTHDFSGSPGTAIPFSLSYTHMDATFDSDIANTDFFGDVSAGDPIPYIPEHKLNALIGIERNRWSGYLSAVYIDETCVRASCDVFEATDDVLIVDISAQYSVNDRLTVFGRVENVGGEEALLGRQPYGARPNKATTTSLGIRYGL